MKKSFATSVMGITLFLASCGQVPESQQTTSQSPFTSTQETERRSDASKVLWSASNEEITRLYSQFKEFEDSSPDLTDDEQEAFLINSLIKLRTESIKPQEFVRGEELACFSVLFVSCVRARLLADQATDGATYSFGSWQTSQDDNERNSMKHAYWNALMAKYIGTADANTIATNHEVYSGDYQKPPSNMDLWNNSKGRFYGATYSANTDRDLKIKVLDAIKRGEMRILKRGYSRLSAPLVYSNTYLSTWGSTPY